MEHGEDLPTALWTAKQRKRSITSVDRTSSSNGDDNSSERRESDEYFPASRLIEYQWPLGLGDDTAQQYLLQEHVAEYLDIRAIQRKYPGLQRRTLGVEERQYLVGRGVVTETQSNMGLVALVSDEVHELMARDYSRKYQEYMDVVQEREFQETLRRKILETKRVASMGVHASDDPLSHRSLLMEAVRKTVEYNSRLSELRKKKSYFDTQTQTLQVPRKQPRVEESGTRPWSRYPVALLPGQYCDYVRRYTPEELTQLPLDTALEVPDSKPPSVPLSSSTMVVAPAPTSRQYPQGDVVAPAPTSRQYPQGDVVTPAPTSRQYPQGDVVYQTHRSEQPMRSEISVLHQSNPSSVSMATSVTPAVNRNRQVLLPKRINTRYVVCSVCYKGRGANPTGEPEDLIHCAQCNNSTHPSCLGMNETASEVARTYAWQCLECKTCQVCGNPDNEDKMVFCDECDRGYHSFCIKLPDIPSGQWLCPRCGSCASCKTTSPGSGPNSKWKHEYVNSKFVQTLCVECSTFFRKGNFCPVCLKVYHNDKTDRPMVCCDVCDRWIHTECDNITKEKYAELSVDRSTYKCCLCRGEVAERVETSHRKHKPT